MTQASWELTQGHEPVVAVALHDGHNVRPEVAALFAVTEADRWREEDPFTATWTAIADTRIIVRKSRFEYDLNRPREKAVYLKTEDAWGLKVWQQQPSPEMIERSLAEYDAFYATIKQVFADIEQRFGQFVVFDLHTYNHRRMGPQALPADQRYNPEINLGTGKINRNRWASVIERFKHDLQNYNFLGRRLDVRENINFQGGHFAYWVSQNFPDSACVLSLEMKKFFMDEWTNELELTQLNAIRCALESTLPGILATLKPAAASVKKSAIFVS